jgi:hypothetical protein
MEAFTRNGPVMGFILTDRADPKAHPAPDRPISGNINGMDEPGHSAGPQVFDLGPRLAWSWLTVGVSMLAVAEAVALAAITYALLPEALSFAVDAVVLIPTLAALIAVASALFGRIVVDSQQFRLYFGLLGGAAVARADIVRAERFMPMVIRPIGLGLGLPFGSGRLTVTRGGEVPYVRVLLGRPVEIRLSLGRRAQANELVVGTGMPDQLIAALG